MARLNPARPWRLGLLGGERVYRSPSPAMHEACLARLGWPGLYAALAVRAEDLAAALKGLTALGFDGLNVTAPLKEAVLPHLTSLAPEALAAGAANTLIPDGDGWLGRNTDAEGFAAAYLLTTPPGRRNLVLGAGGAARAACLAMPAATVVVSSRRSEPGRRMAAFFSADFLPWDQLDASEPWDLIVNATSASSPEEIGAQAPRPPLAQTGRLLDMNYGRPENHWRRWAEACGAEFRDGLDMLACQARSSFAKWTGASPPLEPFLTAIRAWAAEGR